MVPEIRVGVMSLAAVIVTARVILGIAAANADAIQPTSALTVSVESLLPGPALRVGANLIGDGPRAGATNGDRKKRPVKLENRLGSGV